MSIIKHTGFANSSETFKLFVLVLGVMTCSTIQSISWADTLIPPEGNWAVAASTGILDEESVPIELIRLGRVVAFDTREPFEASNNLIRLRYPMVVRDSFLTTKFIVVEDSNILRVSDEPGEVPEPGFSLNVRYRDNGADGQVLVSLMELDLNTEEGIELIRFDSDDCDNGAFPCNEPDSNGFKRIAVNCDFIDSAPDNFESFNNMAGEAAIGFKPTGKAYFVKADIIRNNASGDPALSVIEIRHDPVGTCGA